MAAQELLTEMTEIAPDLYDAEAPEVSIVILNFNKSELTARCLATLWAKTTGRRYEIVVVDNGSEPDEFARLERQHGEFQLVRLPVNRFFGEGNNIGVQASRGKYVVFLNNDAFVTENWLEPLIDVLEREPQAGGAGPKFLYGDGRLQEAGAFIRHDGISIQRGKFYPMEAADLDHPTIVDYCSAACFATTRALLDRVGGFSAIYEPAYYEDADLCFRIASLGRFIYYCPQSVVHHLENGTAVSFSARLALGDVVEINRTKFMARWGDYLRARVDRADAAMPVLPEPRPAEMPRPPGTAAIAVFYSALDLLPGGAARTLLTAAAALRESHHVYVASDAPYSRYRLDFLAHELDLDLAGMTLITLGELRRLGTIDLFVHMGNALFPAVPPQGVRNLHICQFPLPVRSEESAARWSNLRGYDTVLVCSPLAHAFYASRLNIYRHDMRIEMLRPPVPMASTDAAERPEEPLQIVSIGRFFAGGHNNKRHDALIEAMRQLVTRGIEAELHLVGALLPGAEHLRHFDELRRQAAGLPVRFHANAAPAALRALLARATICWHATGFEVDQRVAPERCEYFGIGIVEAMAHGCIPFVVANGGPCEFVRESDTGFLYASIAELVNKTVNLLRDAPGREAVASRARAEAQKFSEQIFVQNWRQVARRRDGPIYPVYQRPFPTPPAETAPSAASPDEARAFIARFPHWYQNIHLGSGIYTIGKLTHHELVWAEFERALPANLGGASVLDIGTNAGYFALQMKRRAAGYVLGTELVAIYLEQAREISRFWNVDIDYREMDAHAVLGLDRQFEVVVFAGIMYHLKNPLQVIEDLGRLSSDAILLETEFAPDDPHNRIMANQGRPVQMTPMRTGFMKFIERRELNDDPSNWWIPDLECINGMLRTAGFVHISRPVVYHGCRVLLVASKKADSILNIEAFGDPARAAA